jgi:hypothetical protein
LCAAQAISRRRIVVVKCAAGEALPVCRGAQRPAAWRGLFFSVMCLTAFVTWHCWKREWQEVKIEGSRGNWPEVSLPLSSSQQGDAPEKSD